MSREDCPPGGIGEHLRKREGKRISVITSVYPGDFAPANGKASAQPGAFPGNEPGGQYTGRRHLALSDRVGLSMKEGGLETRYSGPG